MALLCSWHQNGFHLLSFHTCTDEYSYLFFFQFWSSCSLQGLWVSLTLLFLLHLHVLSLFSSYASAAAPSHLSFLLFTSTCIFQGIQFQMVCLGPVFLSLLQVSNLQDLSPSSHLYITCHFPTLAHIYLKNGEVHSSEFLCIVKLTSSTSTVILFVKDTNYESPHYAMFSLFFCSKHLHKMNYKI